MQTRRIQFIVCVSLIAAAFLFLWNNILVLDDFHPSHESVLETAIAPNSESTVNKGWHIHINLDEVKMYVYKSGQLVKTYPVSGGKTGTPSPLGNWRIISKDTWGEGFGGAWLGFNVPWGKYGIHGTVYPWVIGKSNSSKGCIRMNNKDVRELYRLVPSGTTVTIVHNGRNFRNMKSGDIGSDIYEMQKALRALGYYKSSADGRFGAGMTACVKKFQKDNKIPANGQINRRTYNLIVEKTQNTGS